MLLPRPDAADWRVARLAALASAVHVLEAAFPSPVPGIKPGLANVIVIAALLDYGYATAAAVSLLRVVVGALLAGSFLGPGFALSLSGALASLAALALVQWAAPRAFGAVGLSLIAAFAHLGGQFALARTLLIGHPALDLLLPVLAGAALVTGVVNGVLAGRLRLAASSS